MVQVVYSSTALKKKGDLLAFNAGSFPCHPANTSTVYLNGNFPEIKKFCQENGLDCQPFSKFKPQSKPNKDK